MPPDPPAPLGDVDPDAPAAHVVSAYSARYERCWELPVVRPVLVRSVARADGTTPRHEDRLLVAGDGGRWAARAVLDATGTWTRPSWPRYPGQDALAGRQTHAADHRGQRELAGASVVVVGGGLSAVQLLLEASAVARTTWVTRRPPVFRDDDLDARDAPVGPRGVRHVAADVLLRCTGFRSALDHVAPLHLREPGGGITVVGTRAVREPRPPLLGHGPSAGTGGATRAGRDAVREVRALLGA